MSGLFGKTARGVRGKIFVFLKKKRKKKKRE